VAAGITQTVLTGQTVPADQAVRVRLLGDFAVTAGDRAAGPWPRPSARRLCALLLVSPGRRVSRDLACEELFPRLEPRAAARSLSKALSMARTALAELGDPGAALLGADLTHLWLSPEVLVDADAQADALHAGLALPPGQERDDALAAALAVDGELLPDEPYADWADRARDQLNSLRQEARLVLARDRGKGAGRSGPQDVTAAWLACFDHDPACEEAAGALIRGYLAQGRPEQAARVFERCRAALEQLGLRISPSLERIYASVTAARAPVPQVPPAPSSTAPAGLLGPLAPAVPPAPARPPREERRPLTVLFAEVAAPAGLAGTLGLEALRDLVGGSLATVIAEVEALGGTVTSVSGRGLQAMFGAPEAHEDDPERAVRAAYRAMSAAAAATTAVGVNASGAAETLGLRIGVESGPAVVGPIGGGARVEYAAFGDVVSFAAALQSAARPGSVLVGPATQAATAHLFSWGTVEELTLAADAKPVAAVYLDAPLATAADRRPRLGGRASLVGRRAELRTLDIALREAVAGRGQVIALTGEPGLGKTRLVQESRKRFIGWVGAGSGRRPLWLEGRCVSYASATPYGLYRQLIASWIGVALDQPPARIRTALADALARLFGNTNLLKPLASLMGLPPQEQAAAPARIGPEEMQRQTFAAVRALVARFAAVAPTVLVLEDLHWADPTSLRLTAELAELAKDRPLLLIATSRPGPHALPPAREIRLRALAVDAAEALATSLLGKVGGPQVLAAALANADGNPLFLEERLAEMLEAGTLVRDKDAWRLREPANPPLPQLLERLVRSRVDRLSPAAVDAIRAAAVLGTEFTAGLLAATLGTTAAALAPLLAELSASDLVHHAESSRSVFLFRHALIQEATYLALLRAERRDLHGRAARAIEAAAAGRLPEVAAILGRHYAIAENADRALYYLELAGDHATDAFANDEAIASFREALAVTGRAGDQMTAAAVQLHAKLANVLWRIARRAEARAAFHAALRLADAGPRPLDPVLRAHLYTRLGRLEVIEPRYAEATEAFDAAEALLGEPGHTEGGSPADDVLADQWLELMVDGRADLHIMRLEADRALAMLERARPVLEARGTPARKSAFYRLWTMQKLLRNRLRVDEEDIASLRASVAFAERTGEDKDVGYATGFLGWALWLRGDLPEATEELTNTLALAERIGETLLLDLSLQSLSLTALRRHDTQAVRILLPQTFAAARAAGRHMGGSRIAGRLAVAAWLAWQDGRPDEVVRLVAEIEKYDRSALGTSAMYEWVYLFPLLAARLQAGESAEAVAAARQIIDPSQQVLPDDLTASLAAACESWDQGDPAETARHLTEALAVARARAYF
jgi:class 3 adenylate cyclase/DNA-binding SARP family transcriptional activator